MGEFSVDFHVEYILGCIVLVHTTEQNSSKESGSKFSESELSQDISSSSCSTHLLCSQSDVNSVFLSAALFRVQQFR